MCILYTLCYELCGSYFVSILFCLLGACTVFILLASENLNDLIHFNSSAINPKSEYRIWLVICFCFLLPLTWLGTPKNFWPVALIAIVATTIACLLISIKIGVDYLDNNPTKRKITAGSFASGEKIKILGVACGLVDGWKS